MSSAKSLFLIALVAAVGPWKATLAEAQTLRGSRASVDRIHRQALNHNLRFYETPTAVRQGVERGELVRLSANRNYRVEGVSYPYLLPAAHLFVERLSAQYRSACGEPLVVTSAMRPRSFRLANSSDKSVHPTGMAVDLRRPSNARCRSWLQRTLLGLEAAGVIEAVEERNPPHFHVAVFPDPYRRHVLGHGNSRLATNAAPSTPRRVSAPAAPARRVTYRVRPGDSLWSIARRHGSSVEDLKKANSMRSTRIVVDQVIVIPATAR